VQHVRVPDDHACLGLIQRWITGFPLRLRVSVVPALNIEAFYVQGASMPGRRLECRSMDCRGGAVASAAAMSSAERRRSLSTTGGRRMASVRSTSLSAVFSHPNCERLFGRACSRAHRCSGAFITNTYESEFSVDTRQGLGPGGGAAVTIHPWRNGAGV
jgi:hypothetical protein